MKLAATVIYVDDVVPILDFYHRAFGLETSFVDLDVQLPGREPDRKYQFASLSTEGGTLQFSTHDLGSLLMPEYSRLTIEQTAGVEIAFYTSDVDGAFHRAVDAGAMVVAEPAMMPWGQRVGYVRSIEGTFVGLCSPVGE